MVRKNVFLVFVLLFTLIAPLSGFAAETSYKDVGKSYWAYSSIKWVNDKGLFGGYADGTFRPNDAFTEAQFVTVLGRYFENFTVSNKKIVGHWSQPYYNAFQKYQLPLKGYDSDAIKGAPVTRGTIAQVISASQGGSSDLNAAVQFMYDNNLSKGNTGALTFKDFGVNDRLTRTQAAVFFKRLYDNGFRNVVSYLSGMEYLDTKDGMYGDFHSYAIFNQKLMFATNYALVPLSDYAVNNVGDRVRNVVALGLTGNALTEDEQNYLTYPLLSNFKNLSFTLSLSGYTKNTTKKTIFKVYGDDKELYSIGIEKGFLPKEVNINNLAGVKVLKLELTEVGKQTIGFDDSTEVFLEYPRMQ